MRHLTAIGFGYTAEVLARKLAPDVWRVTGTSRSEAGADAIAAMGYAGALWHEQVGDDRRAATLKQTTHLLISAPPLETGDPVAPHLEAIMDRLPELGWIGYLSTVGVYGDHGGAWVDEETPTNPANERSARRVRAEQDWAAFGERHQRRVQVFRLPGIYGPGRSAFDRLRAGTAQRIIKPGQVFNRIHVGDIAGALETAMTAGHAMPQTINLSDDLPAPAADVITYAAQLMGVDPPPESRFEEAAMSEMARSFYADNKRVSNRRMKEVLGYELEFPTYREGLKAIWAAEQAGPASPDETNLARPTR